jgi:hypothetical protein
MLDDDDNGDGGVGDNKTVSSNFTRVYQWYDFKTKF